MLFAKNISLVAKALVEMFAEMIFIHNFLYGNPHPGNILVSPKAEGQSSFSLEETFKLDYC
ncbi:hypothetical protein VitviT2T_014098 [Vitis vinifera]|uniref:ABC1 atypical kinase-like domain-containing protein n=1 Tax=Vitis vinifera TaxID=29760 RepID=A0ABY9CKX0_VITVI|nr:hypothetical protein VitviT2T_014098 [Vitis vinifera]